MAGLTYSDPKYSNIIRGDVYKTAKAELDSLRLNPNTSDNAIATWQTNNPQIPLYQDSAGEYTLEPTENYPAAIEQFWRSATSTDAEAEKNVIAWPYANGQLSEAGYEKFKAEVKVNKVVALSRNVSDDLTDSVRHDIVQLDADVRDYRIRANFIASNEKVYAEKYLEENLAGKRVFKKGTSNTVKIYMKDIMPDLKIINASISGIGGLERFKRKVDGDNSTYNTYDKKLSLVADEFGIETPTNILSNEMAGDIPVAGEVVAVIEDISVDVDAETGEEAETQIILSNTVNGDGSVYNQDTEEFEGPEGEDQGKKSSGSSGPTFRGTKGKNKRQDKTDQEVDPVASPEYQRWAQFPKGKPQPNILHFFSSYSTQFDLFMLTPNDFNNIQEKNLESGYDHKSYTNVTKEKERLLISTSGLRRERTDKGSSNNRFFTRDYHIDNVNIESYISPSVANGGAKFTNMSCTIFEPYGATLIENLVKASVSDPINGESYLEMPYMFRIKFLGYDDQGNLIDTSVSAVGAEGEDSKQNTDKGTKHLVMKIGNINFKVTPEGTEYEFEFYNYNAFAFENYSGVLESNIQVNSGTLGRFFGMSSVGEDDKDGIVEFEVDSRNLDSVDIEQGFYSDKILRDSGKTTWDYVSNTTTAKNLPEILNSIQYKKTQKDDKGKTVQDTADTFEFMLDAGQFDIDTIDSFFAHKIVKPESYDVNNIPVYNEKVYAAYAQSQKFNKYIPIEGTDSAFQLYAGQSIIDVIRAVIQTSTFMTSQVQSTSRMVQTGVPGVGESVIEEVTYSFENTPEKPLKLYKVEPIVKFGKWDAKRRTYQKHIIYVIVLYTAEGEIQEAMGKYGVTDCVKQYDYLYTGQNKDVLEFDLQFKAGAFELNEIGEFAKFGMQDIISSQHEMAVDAHMNRNAGINAFNKPRKNVKLDQSKGSQGNTSDFPTMISRNLMSRIYQRGTDKMVAEMQIMGDPTLITQDEGFGGRAHAGHFSYNGSINTHKDPIVLINFLTPPDIEGNPQSPHAGTITYNDPVGSSGNTTSVFSGFYKILTIQTNISGNEFTQNLTMARIPQQQYDTPDEFKDMLTESVTKVPGKSTYRREPVTTVKVDQNKSSSTSYRGPGGPY